MYAVSFVAEPSKMGKSPVAMGSSVPPWPTLATRSVRRRWATTWKEVTAGPLSARRRPSRVIGKGAARSLRVLPARGERFPDRTQHHRLRLGEASRSDQARRVRVAAAAEAGGDAGHVHLALGAEAHLH